MASSSSVLSLVVAAMLAWGQAAIAQNATTINVYGPGGPSPAMTECANTFRWCIAAAAAQPWMLSVQPLLRR
jgi:accessory colonization factor AcfC